MSIVLPHVSNVCVYRPVSAERLAEIETKFLRDVAAARYESACARHGKASRAAFIARLKLKRLYAPINGLERRALAMGVKP